MQAIKDRHNAAKHQAQDKLEEMGALDQAEVPMSKAMMKTQLKMCERTLRDTISEVVIDMKRLVTQWMTQGQYQETAPLVKKLVPLL